MPANSSYRRVKDVAYDPDDDYGYEDDEEGQEEGLSAEDQEQMRQSTAAVREVLGSNPSITTKEIEESLYYYYFDVGKTIAYLQKQYDTPSQQQQTTKKQKPPSRFDQAAQAAGTKAFPPGVYACRSSPIPSTSPKPPADFFKDTPFLAVPPHRLGNIIAESLRPRGVLLGGSSNGKPSKLAALAAARKKAQEEKRRNESAAHGDAAAGQPIEPSSSVAMLDKLSLRGDGDRNVPRSENEPQPSRNGNALEKSSQTQPRQYKRQKLEDQPPGPQKTEVPQTASTETDGTMVEPEEDLRAKPSVFATTLLGPEIPQQARPDGSYTFPVGDGTGMANTNPFAGPSPDDVVTNAQTKVKGGGKAPSKKTPAKAADVNGVEQGVAAVKIDDTPKVRSKNIDVAAEYEKAQMEKSANFVVIGHVDHGKSTLMGRLLYDLKLLSSRDYSKLQRDSSAMGKASFALAWAMDSTEEERARGITVDIATNSFETPNGTHFTILDAPGHRDFVPNMIAGAAQADFAILVVDASTGAWESGMSERGQTKEHALLVRSMGISRLVVAINKMDAANWSEDRYNEISQQMSAFLTTAGFQTQNVSFIPCAGLTGENVALAPADLSKDKKNPMPWYTGTTLVAALEASEPARRRLHDPLRMTIADVFRNTSAAISAPVSISGRLDAGTVQAGSAIVAMPSGESATVKAIEVDSEPRDWAAAGMIATLHLVGIDMAHLRAGDVVTDGSLPNARAFTARVLAFEHVVPGPVEVHRGRLHGVARVAELLSLEGKAAPGEPPRRKRPRIVKPGQVARVRVVLEAERGLPLEAPDRVVLRSEGTTVAAGLLENVEA